MFRNATPSDALGLMVVGFLLVPVMFSVVAIALAALSSLGAF